MRGPLPRELSRLEHECGLLLLATILPRLMRDREPDLMFKKTVDYIREELDPPETGGATDPAWLLFLLSDGARSPRPYLPVISVHESDVKAGIQAIRNWKYPLGVAQRRWDAVLQLFNLRFNQVAVPWPTFVERCEKEKIITDGGLEVTTELRDKNTEDDLQGVLDWAFEFQITETQVTVKVPVIALKWNIQPSVWVAVKRTLQLPMESTAADRYALLFTVCCDLSLLFRDMELPKMKQEECIQKIEKVFKAVCPVEDELLVVFRAGFSVSQIINIARGELAVMTIDELLRGKEQPAATCAVSKLEHSVRWAVIYYLRLLCGVDRACTPLLEPCTDEIPELLDTIEKQNVYAEWEHLKEQIRATNRERSTHCCPFQIEAEVDPSIETSLDLLIPKKSTSGSNRITGPIRSYWKNVVTRLRGRKTDNSPAVFFWRKSNSIWFPD